MIEKYKTKYCSVERHISGRYDVYIGNEKILACYELQEAITKCDKLEANILAAEQDMPTEDAIAQVKEFSYLYL